MKQIRLYIKGKNDDLRYFYGWILLPYLSNLDAALRVLEWAQECFIPYLASFPTSATSILTTRSPDFGRKQQKWEASGKLGEALEDKEWRAKVVRLFNFWVGYPVLVWLTLRNPTQVETVLKSLEAECQTIAKGEVQEREFLAKVVRIISTGEGLI